MSTFRFHTHLSRWVMMSCRLTGAMGRNGQLRAKKGKEGSDNEYIIGSKNLE